MSRRSFLTQELGGITFRATGPKGAVEDILQGAISDTASSIHLANAYTVALADRDDELRELLNTGTVYADGKPLSWLSSLLSHVPRVEQVRGPQLFLDVFNFGRDRDIRHFLLGSTEDTLSRIQARLVEQFPGVQIVGKYSPPFRPLTEEERSRQDEWIRASRAQVVWVGLGTPKQDWEAHRLAAATQVTSVAVGAAFDFAAGIVPPAPEWIQRFGFEWLYRLAKEPRRLWRRYLFGNLRFLRVAARDLVSRGAREG